MNKQKLVLGKNTSSKKIVAISDIHDGSDVAVCTENGPYKMNVHQKELLGWWEDCTDEVGKSNVLLLNGEPINGPNQKQGGFQNWSSDINVQLADAEKLIKKWKFDKLLMTRGSEYHIQHGWTNYEETLARSMGAIPYQGMFYHALNEHTRHKGRRSQIDNSRKDGVPYWNRYTDYYIFFDVFGRLFNATHHIGYNRWFAYRTTALAREMADMEFARGKYYDDNREIDVMIRSHVHYFVHVEYGNSHGFTTPAWKFPDAHLFRGGMGGTYPTVGAIEIIVEPNGKLELKKHIMPLKKLPKPRVLML